MDIQKSNDTDNWQSLKKFTTARIALGSTGVALPLKEVLQFRLAHANARDAVYSRLHETHLIQGLQQLQLTVALLQSKAPNRDVYLQQPGLGRQLDSVAVQQLEGIITTSDIALVIADGLSATAINLHAIPLLQLLIPLLLQSGFTLAPVSIVQQARVAVADEVAILVKAKLSLLLIGERPGLSSPHSMSAYLTFSPAPGLTDESRNCVSNIHSGGMDYTAAAEKIYYLVNEAFRLQYSGTALKDNAGLLDGYQL